MHNFQSFLSRVLFRADPPLRASAIAIPCIVEEASYGLLHLGACAARIAASEEENNSKYSKYPRVQGYKSDLIS